MNKDETLIILDWDGTLCNTDAYGATREIFKRCKLPPPTLADFVEYFGHPFLEYYRKRGISADIGDQQIWDWYVEDVKHDEADLFPDVIPALTAHRNAGHPIALVTSQVRPVIDDLMARHSCDHLFDLIECTPGYKAKAFTHVCSQMNVDPATVYCVGDFASDMVQAKEAKTIPIGIVRDREHVKLGVAQILHHAEAYRVITRLQDLFIPCGKS